ncbi:hypothetical protein FRC17_001436 [Serendipita sp. 399]|nr:hypothetical protein FRC17_001436 [Serendipita sp. 399]
MASRTVTEIQEIPHRNHHHGTHSSNQPSVSRSSAEIQETYIGGTITNQDLEMRTPTAFSSALASQLDPYSLKRGLKTDDELRGLKQRKKKKEESYYTKQNMLIGDLLKPLEEHVESAKAIEEKNHVSVKIAIYASLGANIALSALQLFAAVKSGSLSLLATAIDSIFDPMSNVLLWALHRKSTRLDVNKWPVGGERLTTIGNICYGSLMAAINLVVCVESIRTIIEHKKGDPETNKLFVPALVAVGSALGVKLALFFLCYGYRKYSTQVEMLYQDHRNDLFVNSFGLLMSAGGSKLKWFIDPIGGFIIAFGVIIAWCRTIYHEFELLAGKSAPVEFLQLITYKVATFSDEIEKVDTIRAYHTGPDLFVEVDIVMSGETPLYQAHDLSQQLQDKLETLPGVCRAFVHVDHETTHQPVSASYCDCVSVLNAAAFRNIVG